MATGPLKPLKTTPCDCDCGNFAGPTSIEITEVPPDHHCARTKIPVHLRWMIRRDMEEVLAIEKQCFGLDAWSNNDFTRCLRQRNCIGMVAEDRRTDQILGHWMYMLHKTKIELINFAVAPNVRRCGIGRQMVDKLIGKLSHDRRPRVVTNIRETNLDACNFFKAMGFRAVGILRDAFKFADGTSSEDAYKFVYRLGRIES